MAETTPRPNEELELEPWYRDGNDDVVEPDRVTLQTQYFWTHWLRILGAGPTVVLIRLRMHCYYNKRTGENRNTCYPGIMTLADELGVERKAVMRYLARLEVFDFIRRKKRTRWSEVHNRPVRTTDLYRVKMWDPVAPEHEGAAFVKDAERLIADRQPEAAEIAAGPERSQKGTYGNPPVDQTQRSQKGTDVVVPKRDHRKKYLERVPNERNVDLAITNRTESGPVALGDVLTRTLSAGTPLKGKKLADVLPQIQTSAKNKDRLERVEDLAGQILEVLGDGRSRPFYRMVARRFLDAGRDQLVYQLLSEIKVGAREGQLKNPAAVFTARIKELAQLSDIAL